MIADKGCAERGCACYDDRIDTDGVEMIELKPNQTAIVLNEHGHLVEFYMPKHKDDDVVPDNIVQIMRILL